MMPGERFAKTALVWFGVLLASTLPATADEPTDQPRIEITPQVFDLGDVEEGRIVEAVFVVKNAGQTALEITKVKTSCACTTAKLPPADTTIQPGGQIDLKVSFNSQGRRGPQAQTVTVSSNDPDAPHHTAILKAHVKIIYRASPRRGIITAKRLRRGAPIPMTYDLLPDAPQSTLELVELSLPTSDLDYAEEPLSGPEERTGVRVRFSVSDLARFHKLNVVGSASVRVGAETATLPFRVVGSVVGNLVFAPALVRQDQPAPRGRELRPITVTAAGEAEITIVDVDAGPYLTAEIVPVRDRYEYTVRLWVNDAAPDGPFGHMVAIRTDRPDEPVVDVPVFVNVKPRVRVDPRIVVLTRGEGRDGGGRMVRLEAGTGVVLQLSEVRCDRQYIHAERVSARGRVRPNLRFVRVWLSDDAPADGDEARLILRTNINGAEVIEVPVVIQNEASDTTADAR